MGTSSKVLKVLLLTLLVLHSPVASGYIPLSYFPTGNQLAGLDMQTPGLLKGFTDQTYRPDPNDSETHAFMNVYPVNSVYATITTVDEASTTEVEVKAYEMRFTVTIKKVPADYDIYDDNSYYINQYAEQSSYGNGYLLSHTGQMPQTGGAYLNQQIMYTKGEYFVNVWAHVHMAPELSGEQLSTLQVQAFNKLRTTTQSLAGIVSGNLGDQGGGSTDIGNTGTGDTGNSTGGNKEGEDPETKSPLDIVKELQDIALNSINKLKQQIGQGAQPTVTPYMTEFKNPEPEPKLTNGQPVSQQGKQKAEERKDKIIQIGAGAEVTVIEVKTPSGVQVKIAPVVDPGLPSVSVDPDLAFKIKYQANKKIIDPFIDALADKIAEKIPLIGLYKDYFKSDKDTNLFNDEEAIKKTQADLKVSGQAAKIYNDMSGIEDREKMLSPAKNLIPSNTMTKPFEYVIQQLGTGVKKKVANGYRKEYEIAKRTAVRYKEMGWTYSEIITTTISDVKDETAFNANTQMLNVQSKGVFKNQKDRIGAYIIQMKDDGTI